MSADFSSIKMGAQIILSIFTFCPSYLLIFIIFSLILIYFEIKFFILDNKKYKSSYEIKTFMPERHLNKNSIPHMGGMFIFPTAFISFILFNLYKNINYFENFSKGINRTLIFTQFYRSKEIISFFISNSLDTITIIFIIRIIITGFYFMSKDINKNNVRSNIFTNISLWTPIISWFSCLFVFLSLINKNILIVLYSNLNLTILNKFYQYTISTGLNSYLSIIYFFNSIIIFLAMPLLCYMILYFVEKKVNNKETIEEKNLIIRKSLYSLIFIVPILFIIQYVANAFQFFIFKNIGLYNFFSNKFQSSLLNYELISFLSYPLIRDIAIIIFPLLMGGIDDINKINKNIIKFKNKYKFLLFTCLGAGLSPYLLDRTLYYNLLEIVKNITIKYIPILKYLAIAFVFFMRGILFNTTINTINFTDGADGLLFLSTIGYLLTLLFLTFQGLILMHSYVFLKMNNRFSYLLWIHSRENILILFFILIIVIAMSIFFSFNKKPAKVMIGETGSWGLATSLFMIMLYTSTDIHLFLSCFMCYFQVISCLIQILAFKFFKKSVFKIAPFHHHLEVNNYSDNFILLLYTLINLTLALLSMFVIIGFPYLIPDILNFLKVFFKITGN